mgnify:CR=1 FL=1
MAEKVKNSESDGANGTTEKARGKKVARTRKRNARKRKGR